MVGNQGEGGRGTPWGEETLYIIIGVGKLHTSLRAMGSFRSPIIC